MIATVLRDERHGPLPLVLLLLTLVTGLVDAISFLKLDHVFVANMTGNVAFLGFSLIEPHHFSMGQSSTAIAAFMLGAVVGGRVVTHFGDHRGRLLRAALVAEVVLVAVALVVAWPGIAHESGPRAYALVVILASTMGLQNAAARGVGVPDISTTALTTTLSNLASDSAWAGREGIRSGRRMLAVAVMCAGAAIGAVLTLHAGVVVTLLTMLGILLGVAVMSWRLAASDATWTVDPLRLG